MVALSATASGQEQWTPCICGQQAEHPSPELLYASCNPLQDLDDVAAHAVAGSNPS